MVTHVIVALTDLPIGYSVIVALTGLPIGYSVIVALTGLPIGYSVIVALTGLPIGYSVHRFSSYLQQYSTDGIAHTQNRKQEVSFISGLTLL